MPTTLTNGIQLPDKGSVDWYSSMQSNYNLIDTHLGDTDTHVTAEDRANWNSKQGSLSQAQLDAIAQVATNTSDIATLQSDKADASHTHSSSDITDIGDYATKQYVDNSISDLVDSAPAALDTLKELSTALNDDANFASTVTTALATKANSADLATVATSGSYTDLDDKPTINDSTITIQKNGSTVDTFTTNGSAKTIDIPVPTKTSDLTNDSDFVVSSSLAAVATSGFYNDLENKPYIPDKISDLIDDSNFVDTSNPAVASGITSAKVTSYDTHIADTDIHVTTADKATWNTVTSKANDNDVVHKSGDETVGGKKTFSENITCFSNSDAKSIICKTPLSTYDSTNTVGDNTKIRFLDKNNNSISYIMQRKLTNGSTDISLNVSNTDSNNQPIEATLTFILDSANDPRLSPGIDNTISLGRPTFRWKSMYATNYYYGSNNVEFSTKFVTTDTAQTISGDKVWTGTNIFQQNVTYQRTNFYHQNASPCYILKDTELEKGSLASTHTAYPGLWQDKNNNVLGYVRFVEYSSGRQTAEFRVSNLIKNGALDPTGTEVNCTVNLELQPSGEKSLIPERNNDINLGTSTNKWKTFNGVEPSSLSLPSDRSARIDISSYFTNTGTGNKNNYSVPANGFIFLNLLNTFAVICYSIDGTNNINYAQSFFRQVDGQIYILFPVRKNDTFRTLWTSNGGTITVTGAHFIPCLGNV